MRKILLTLLALLSLGVSGAWAKAQYTLNLGTAASANTSSTFLGNFTYSSPGNWSTSAVSKITTTNPIPITLSTTGSYLSGWDCAIAAHNTSSFVISAPEDYVITSYSFGVQTHNAAATCSVIPASDGAALVNVTSESGSTAIVSEAGISESSVTINISDVVTANNECKLYLNDLTITLAQVSDELILNGGFEWGDNYWSLTATNEAKNEIIQGSGNSHSGTYATDAGNWQQSAVASYTTSTTHTQAITLAAGKYELSFAYRAYFSTGGTITATLTNNSTSEETKVVTLGNLSDPMATGDNGGTWRTSTTQFNIAESGTFTFALNVATSDNGVYSFHRFDDISLKKVPSPITSLEEIVPNKVYTICPDDADRGVLYSKNGYLDACGGNISQYSGANNTDVLVNASDKAQQFAFVSMDNKLYLYSVSEKKFANRLGKYIELTDEKAPTYITVEPNNTEWFIKFNGSNLLNISTGWEHGALADYNTPDSGNSFIISSVDDVEFDPAEALTILEDCLEPVDAGVYSISYASTGGVTDYFSSDAKASFYCSGAGLYRLEPISGDNKSNNYYIIENETGNYLYAKKAGLEGVGTTDSGTSSYRYRDNDIFALSNEVNAELGDFEWIIDEVSSGKFTIKPVSNTNTAIAVYSADDTYFSFLETNYSWASATFKNIEATIEAYFNEQIVNANLMKAGKVGYPKTSSASYTDLYALVSTFTGGHEYTSSDWNDLKNKYTAYKNESDVVLPVVGKFYSIYNANANKYIHSVSPGSTLALNESGTSADAIFYVIENGRFLSYSKGYAMGAINIWGTTYSSGGYYTYTLDHVATQNFGTLRITYSTNNSFYQNGETVGNTTQDDTRTGVKAAWTFTEVTSLPVTISAIGFNSFYCPVDVIVPEGVTAYTGTIDGNVLKLSPINAGDKIPANTGVILEGTAGANVSFVITTDASSVNSDLLGTVAAKAKTEGDLVLGYKNEKPGFYTYSGDNLGGFKSYIPADKAGQVKSFDFDFFETGVQALQQAKGNVVYDLNGRRVQNARKGLYIVNGHKVVIR